jgi:sigma-B regulation protein RsbU (phosphoserine phosphatase)
MMENIYRFFGDISILADPFLNIRNLNKSLFDFLGYEEHELIGKPIGLVLPDFSLEPLLNGSEYIPFTDTVMINKQGDSIAFAVSASALYDERKKLVGIGLLLQDVSGRNSKRISLNDLESRYRAMIDYSLDAVVMINTDNQIIEWNHKAEEQFGWTKEEAIGKDMSDLIVPETYRNPHKLGMKRFLSTGETQVLNQRLEMPALHRDGYEFPVELTVTAIEWGDTYLFSAFLRDITRRKRYERDILAAKEAAESIARISGDDESRNPHPP